VHRCRLRVGARRSRGRQRIRGCGHYSIRPATRSDQHGGTCGGRNGDSQLLPEEVLLHDRRPARSRVAIISAVNSTQACFGILIVLPIFSVGSACTLRSDRGATAAARGAVRCTAGVRASPAGPVDFCYTSVNRRPVQPMSANSWIAPRSFFELPELGVWLFRSRNIFRVRGHSAEPAHVR
jgi:hypothetical protein